MQKNQILQLTIESHGAFGEGVAHADDCVIFVPFAIEGEVVEVKILSVKKGIAYAKLLNVLQKSDHRREPICPFYSKCGGCDIQHIDYERGLNIKKEQVKGCLKRIAKLDACDIIVNKSEKLLSCRNKLTLPFGEKDGKVVLGFYSERTHKVIDITRCIMGDRTDEIISIFTDWANLHHLSVYDEQSGKGLLRSLSARESKSKFMFTLVATSPKVPFVDELLQKLNESFDKPTIYLNINKQNTNVVLGDKNILLSGEKRLKCNSLGINYELSPFSFAQVNDNVRDKLYTKVLSFIDEKDIVIDAYSGAGLMSTLIAKKAQKVYGAEIVEDAVKDADYCAKQNGVSDKVINKTGDCAKLVPELVKEIGKVDNLTVVLDPPRKGCDSAVLESVTYAKPNKIIYVSCNPATLARDLVTLKENYSLQTVEIFDMFPWTKHVETVVCLTRRLDNELRERVN